MKDDLIYYENNKKSFSLTIGFDGIWLYFENERERFGLINYNLLVNQKNLLLIYQIQLLLMHILLMIHVMLKNYLKNKVM